jgi:actin-related protein 9
MFPAQQAGEYEPVKIRKKDKKANQPHEPATNGDEEPEWEEDRISEEGAIWPIQSGSITDWPCFYALMEHVYNTVNPPFHTPILLISQPVWTHKEYEKVAQFFFEKFKTPALAMMDSAVATTYAYGIATATVVDVGLNKADVTCVADFILHDIGRSLAVPDCGGESMTQRLTELLHGRKGFTRDVCEQLKRSAICEVLPPDVPLPDANADTAGNPAAAASTGADGAAPGQAKPSIAGDLPRGPGPGTEVGEADKLENDEGVLDIASIVTGGNMQEYLAQKEREKAEKAAAKGQKKITDTQQQAKNPVRVANSKRSRNTFVYEDFALHDAMKTAGMTAQGMTDMQSALDDAPSKEPQSAVSEKPADSALTEGTTDTSPTGGFRREIEVGSERFQAASGGLLDRLADAIHRTVLSCSDIGKRSELWDSLIILGNGSKVRGFKEALIATLQAKYIISPSSATIFTSELPSNISTPLGTGANTPQHQVPGYPQQHGAGVNPLLHAALTAQHPQFQQPGQAMQYSSKLHNRPLVPIHSPPNPPKSHPVILHQRSQYRRNFPTLMPEFALRRQRL